MRQYYSSSSGTSASGSGGGRNGGPLSPESSGIFSASDMAETASSLSTAANLGAYNPSFRNQNSSSTPQRPYRPSPGSSRRVTPPSPNVVGVVGNGRMRTASRRLGSSPLATQQPITPTGEGASLSTIPEMRTREREERESATASSFSGGVTSGEYKIGVVSPSTNPNASMGEQMPMPTPVTMPVPHPVEPPWSELGEITSSGTGMEEGTGQNSSRKDRWNRTFGDRMVKFS